ncbi:MAG: hypothetical protein EOM20_12385 [Spartobacteria bacterium]|nr:hypothetical protein [Spartobacteria bacterium]
MNPKHTMGHRLNSKRGLWTWIFLIIIFGGLLAWFFATRENDLDAERRMLITIATTVIASGILIISATANWWLKR